MAVANKRRRKTHRLATQRAPVREIIGRVAPPDAQNNLLRSRFAVTTVDATVPDYAFYDQLRRGKLAGYKLGALFAKRIEHIFAVWTLGRGVTVTLAEAGEEKGDGPITYTNGKLADFVETQHALLMTVKEDAFGLGDQYIIINADGSLSVPSPDTVDVKRDPLDYRTVLSVTITTKLPKATIIDEYRADGRTVTVKQLGSDGKSAETVTDYENLIGLIPCVQIAHGKSGNETNGHSVHEDLLKLYDQYDDVIHKQLDGAKLLGNPLLALVGMEDLAAVIDANKPQETQTYIDRDGNEVNRTMLNIDANSILLVGKGGDAKFVAPPTGFTTDTSAALSTLFNLIQYRTGIPEFAWGNEQSSARATSETQMRQWAHDIEGMQKVDETWLLDLCEIWLTTLALTDRQIMVDTLTVEWPPVLDENQELRLKMLQYASGENLLSDETKLKLTELPVEDLAAEVAAGQDAAQTRAGQEQERMMAQAAQAAKQPAANAGAIGEMSGYNEGEASAIVAGALRIVAGV